MERLTIGAVVRAIADQTLKSGIPTTVPFDAIVSKLENRERHEIDFEEMEALCAALKKRMNASYVATTVNRMKSVQAEDKSCQVSFGKDDDRGGVWTVTIGLKPGAPKKKQIEQATEDAQQRKRGAKLALEKVLAFSPDISEVTPENLGSVQSVVSQYRDFINEMLGGSDEN